MLTKNAPPLSEKKLFEFFVINILILNVRFSLWKRNTDFSVGSRIRIRTNTLSGSIWTTSNSDVVRISPLLAVFGTLMFNLVTKAFRSKVPTQFAQRKQGIEQVEMCEHLTLLCHVSSKTENYSHQFFKTGFLQNNLKVRTSYRSFQVEMGKQINTVQRQTVKVLILCIYIYK